MLSKRPLKTKERNKFFDDCTTITGITITHCDFKRRLTTKDVCLMFHGYRDERYIQGVKSTHFANVGRKIPDQMAN